jgi:hypothetical protein
MKKKPWFKAKMYGWGWYPSSWQGWLVLFLFILLNVITFIKIDKNSHSVSDTLIGFVPALFVLCIFLICIAYKTGEKPRWRWGK